MGEHHIEGLTNSGSGQLVALIWKEAKERAPMALMLLLVGVVLVALLQGTMAQHDLALFETAQVKALADAESDAKAAGVKADMAIRDANWAHTQAAVAVNHLMEMQAMDARGISVSTELGLNSQVPKPKPKPLRR